MVPCSPQPERHRLHSSSYIWHGHHNLKDTDYTVAAIYGMVMHNLKDTDYTVAAIYGMVMHSRNPQLTAFQKMVAVSCIRHHAGNGVSFNIVFKLLQNWGSLVPGMGGVGGLSLSFRIKKNKSLSTRKLDFRVTNLI